MSYTSKEEARTPFLRLLEHEAQVCNWGHTVRQECFRPWYKSCVRRERPEGTITWLKGKGRATLYVASVLEILACETRPCNCELCGRAPRKPRCGPSHGSQCSVIGTFVLAPKSPDLIPCPSCVQTDRVISFNEWVCNLLLLIKVISLPEFKNPG